VDTTASRIALVGVLAALALTGCTVSAVSPAAVQRETEVANVSAVARPKPKARPVVAANGVPTVIVRQLAKHRVVVVSVFADGATVDTLARDEARAGARDAHAGFAAVNVADKRLARALADGTKRLSAPDLIVFHRRLGVVNRFHGFADRTLVAQLAATVR